VLGRKTAYETGEDEMDSMLPVLRQECARFRDRFGVQPLGVVEIGSFARGEAVLFSDRDLRLIVRCADPLIVLDEHRWTEGTCEAKSTIGWQDLNHREDLSLGLTNLAFVERMIQAGCYPLIDHTCLYQGQILLDESNRIAAFRVRYHRVRFPNIVPDYLRQVEWRVAVKLPRELATLGESLDHRKRVVPPMHTCYRIIRDLANIASFHAHGVYAGAPDDIARYYHEHWPWFEATFQTLRGYKTDARLRQEVFDDVAQGRPECLHSVRLCAQATIGLWEEFEAEYR
jgi:hypothetical protein